VRDVDVDGGVEVSDENVGECRTLLSEKKGVEKRRSSALPGASFSSPLGMEWHERRRLLIVAGRGDQGGGVGVGVWRYGGGDDDEFLVPIAFTASRGGGPVGGGVGGGGGANGAAATTRKAEGKDENETSSCSSQDTVRDEDPARSGGD
jgi:hypothetical protein